MWLSSEHEICNVTWEGKQLTSTQQAQIIIPFKVSFVELYSNIQSAASLLKELITCLKNLPHYVLSFSLYCSFKYSRWFIMLSHLLQVVEYTWFCHSSYKWIFKCWKPTKRATCTPRDWVYFDKTYLQKRFTLNYEYTYTVISKWQCGFIEMLLSQILFMSLTDWWSD